MAQTLPHRSRTVAAALALFAGALGAHRWYLRSKWWWVYPLVALPAMGIALRADFWYRHPGFFVASLVAVAAMLEAIVFSLATPQSWDARHNAGSSASTTGGWAPVLVAIASLMLGATLLMSVLAIALEEWFRSTMTP